jgi:hypothetical protein
MYLNITWEYIPPTVNAPNKLYGIGLNETATKKGNTTLRFNHSGGECDFFEVQHSTNGITFSYLDKIENTSKKEYIHNNLLNGSYNWYRIRACKYKNGQWYNSSWSNINLERVMFILTSGTGNQTIIQYIQVPVIEQNMATILLPILILLLIVSIMEGLKNR